jgi:hypothetical protein
MEVVLGDRFEDGKRIDRNCMVMVLFTARKYPPHLEFLSSLIELYEFVNQSRKVLEIVGVMLDESKNEFYQSALGVPWLTIPFDSHRRIKRITDFYQITEVPALILIDHSGEQVLKNCKDDIERLGKNAFEFWLAYLNKSLESSVSKG